jgi:NAD(P)-dependent dehydrogenase (short-subunit alcohol dehydrogenase family)
MPTSCLVIGGTGAQGAAVVRALALSGKYTVKVLTRDVSSSHAQELRAPTVSLIEGDCFNEADLSRAFEGIESCFVNTNGFAVGEKSEIYWGIRIYEIAVFAGVRHFVYGGLDYCSRKAGFNPKYRCHHYDAKGKVGGEYYKGLDYGIEIANETISWRKTF